MKAKEDNRTVGEEIVSCFAYTNSVHFSIGKQQFTIYSGTTDNQKYELIFYSYNTEEPDDENVLFDYSFELTPEEWNAAIESTLEDWMFTENVDSLIVKRVAKDIFSTLLVQLGTGIEKNFEDRLRAEWKAYALYLIRERLAGRLIASYLPGFEPKKETESSNDNQD